MYIFEYCLAYLVNPKRTLRKAFADDTRNITNLILVFQCMVIAAIGAFYSLKSYFFSSGFITLAGLLTLAWFLIDFYLTAAILFWVGKYLDGSGTYKQARTILAYATIPSLFGGIMIYFTNSKPLDIILSLIVLGYLVIGVHLSHGLGYFYSLVTAFGTSLIFGALVYLAVYIPILILMVN